MSFRFTHAAVAVCLASASLANAAETPLLTLPQAVERARALHPQLAGFVLEMRAQDARVAQAQLRPAPQAEVQLEDFAGTGERRGLDGAETTLSLSQLFEWGGKRSARSEVADAQRARLRTDQAARQLDVVAEVGRRFVQLLAQQERVRAAREALVLAGKVQAAIEERVRAAASPEAERSRAVVATAEADLELEDALHDLETARFELAAAMGLARPDFPGVAGDLFATATRPADFDALMARVEASPDFLRFTDEARLRDAELRLAQRQRSGDPRASLGLRRFEQGDDTALVAGVSLPLFASHRAQPGIAIAQAERDQLASTRQGALLKARAHLFAQHQEMEHARHVATTLGDRILPQLAKAMEQTEYAYRRGRYSYLEWSDARRRLLEARNRRIDAASRFHIHRIEIERLTGESLVVAGESS